MKKGCIVRQQPKELVC